VYKRQIRDRRHLAEEGIVLPVIAIDKRTGKLEGVPEIVSRGFALPEGGEEILEQARQVVIRTLESATTEERTDSGVIKEKIRADLRRFIARQTARHPLILPVVLEI